MAIRARHQSTISGAESLTGSGHHERHPDLTEALVGDSDHRHLPDVGVVQHEVLDLGGIGVEAAHDEHVLHPPDDAQATGTVDHADVPGAQPPVGRQRQLGGLGIVEVAGHDAPAAQHHLTGLSGGDVPTVVDDADLEAGPGPADRGGDGLDVVVGGRRRRRSRLGEAVAGDDDRERQFVVDAADQFDGDVGRSGHRHPQRRQSMSGPVGMVEDGLVERRRSGEDGHLLAIDAPQDVVDVEDRLGEHGGPAGHAGQDARLQPEHVEVRVHHEVPVVGAQPGHLHPVGGHATGCGRGSSPPPWAGPSSPR